MAEGVFLDGAVRYPDDLPCPHADTDLTPRERRYISDIGEVKKLRRFQSIFQATRKNISFVFTPEQARVFREWYKNDIVEGGAWFYADWAILHKETRIAYRFVTRPVWEFLARGNYHVSATVELYEGRKVGKTSNVYTTKIYPVYISDNITSTCATIDSARIMPGQIISDDIAASEITISSAVMSRYIYSTYQCSDGITASNIVITEAIMKRYIYSTYQCSDGITASNITIDSATATYNGKLVYNKFVDDVTASHITIVEGETS